MTANDRSTFDDLLAYQPKMQPIKTYGQGSGITSFIVSDNYILVRRVDPDSVDNRFRIGELLLCEPDYQQILRWAEDTKQTPENVLDALAISTDSHRFPDRRYPVRFEIINGAIKSLAYDPEYLSIRKFRWVSGLQIETLAIHRHMPKWDTNEALLSVRNLSLTGLKIPGLDLSQTPDPQEFNLDQPISLETTSEFDLSRTPNLHALICCRDKLTSLDLTPVPRLQYLDCTENRLQSLDLSPVPELARLDCSGNRLQSLHVPFAPELARLDCEANHLGLLDLISVPKLTELDCSNNPLGVLNLPPESQLTLLCCDSCNLKSLDLSPVPELTVLLCRRNPLSELDLTPVPKLTHLNLARCDLGSLDLSPVPNLTGLVCENNRLMQLDLTPVPKLELLFCAGNHLTGLNLDPLDNPESIDFDYHFPLKTKPSDMRRLKELEAENAKLRQMYVDLALANAELKDILAKRT